MAWWCFSNPRECRALHEVQAQWRLLRALLSAGRLPEDLRRAVDKALLEAECILETLALRDPVVKTLLEELAKGRPGVRE